MRKRVKKCNSYLAFFVALVGIQFLLLPFYHFHPDNQHSHPGELPSHQHNAYFHSIELDSIAHLTHSHDHNLETAHHSQHSESNGEYHPKIELNKETLKSKNPFKVLSVFSNFTSFVTPQKFRTYYLPIKPNDLFNLAFQHQLRERSPPSLYI